MPSILIMEDDVQQGRLLVAGLENVGHDVTIVTDARDAWEALSESRFDLLITDMYVPTDVSEGGGGVSLLGDIRIGIVSGRTPWLVDMPIMVITGMVSLTHHPINIPLAEHLKVDAAFMKPISLDKITDEVDRLLAENVGARNQE